MHKNVVKYKFLDVYAIVVKEFECWNLFGINQVGLGLLHHVECFCMFAPNYEGLLWFNWLLQTRIDLLGSAWHMLLVFLENPWWVGGCMELIW